MTKQYTLVKIPVKEIILQNFNLTISREEEIEKEYLVAQESSLLFDQIERLREKPSDHISEIILVVAKKNPKQENDLRRVLKEGFHYNGTHYKRLGKSASQGKAGITAFVCDNFYDRLYAITQMDIKVNDCVISKYEAQRCLVFSSCTLIKNYMPNIVIIDEYKKILPDQYIKYVVTSDQRREIREGYKDLEISPFDGCGCHEHEFMKHVRKELDLDYDVAGAQIRLPFMKGYSVYVPFRKILKEWGYDSITDIYGHSHPVDTIDCIWNISMFKGHGIFKEKYGDKAWTAYMDTLNKYQFKLGISKYSHHIRQISRYTRMNFQYLQCLNLWNPEYIHYCENREDMDYDILDPVHDGKATQLARYTTNLFEKIIQGETFYTYKYMGITDTEKHKPKSRYLEAALINEDMLKDPAVKQFIYRKLKKSIDEAKVGKIYSSGFYHTGVGDMIGYLQFAAGETPVGCLNAGELYSSILNQGDILSFRSPLVDPSEVNKIKIVRNDIINRWFDCFCDQDIVMFNMYDISAPQQGGADFDGDIFFLCDDPVLTGTKIDKPIILDIEDKITAESSPMKDIYDLMVQKYDAQLSYMKSIIDAKKQVLDMEKDLYDYEKNISDQQNMLDNMYAQYEDLLTALEKDFETVVNEGIKLINETAGGISQTLNSIAERYNYVTTEDMTSIMGSFKESGLTKLETIFNKLADEIRKSYNGGNGGSAGNSGSGNNNNGNNPTTDNTSTGGTPNRDAVNEQAKEDAENAKTQKEDLKKILAKANYAKKAKKAPEQYKSRLNQILAKETGYVVTINDAYSASKFLQALNANGNGSAKPGKDGSYYAKDGNIYKKLQEKYPLLGFRTGGIVRADGIPKDGDNIRVRVNPDETILTQDFTKLLPDAVDTMKHFVTITDYSKLMKSKASGSNFGNIIVNTELPNVVNAQDFVSEFQNSKRIQKAFEIGVRDCLSHGRITNNIQNII